MAGSLNYIRGIKAHKSFIKCMENDKSSSAKWYVLHTFAGHESVAQRNLERVVEKFGLEDRIFEIVIPMEEVIEEKDGKKVLVTRKLMPSYLLVKMIYADDIWHSITRTRGITGFVGPLGRPLPLTENEIMKMRLEKAEVDTSIVSGDKVEIISGALNEMVGTVLSVDLENQRSKVSVEMFGRETTVNLKLDEIRKID